MSIDMTKYETGADFFRDNAVSYGVDEALVIGGNYLATQLQGEQSRDEHQFCRELFAAMHEAASQRTDSAKLVYPYDFQKASERLEASLYHSSRKLNVACAHAIDNAINAACYQPNYYNLDLAAMKAVHDFGFARVNLVLAHNFQQRDYDGRFSSSNKTWAREMPVVENAFGRAVLNAHPVLLDSFANHARKLYDEVGAERSMLPGRPESGEQVQGYEIVRSIAFDNNRGFAIGLNPEAPSPFVCWQFTVEGGMRDFYWGAYSSDIGDAAQNYVARIMTHMDGESVKEIPNPLAAAEMSAEQNYNMLDGRINNEPAPKPQREEKPSLLGRLNQLKSEQQPRSSDHRSTSHDLER